MKHLDLFSGIGGFAYAVDQVWEGAEHIFCDNDKYCQAVLKKHWPQSQIWSDIRELITHAKEFRQQRDDISRQERRVQSCAVGGIEFTTNTKHSRHVHKQPEIEPAEGRYQTQREPKSSIQPPFILTGGFPCQPFSHAGKRRGKSDDRFLWPEMLECIRVFKPTWVIAENVFGILSIEGGLVFEQVCSGMEKAGYEVWPFIIPACAINAHHRRDRVWMVAHAINDQHRGGRGQIRETQEIQGKHRQALCSRGFGRTDEYAANPTGKGLEGQVNQEGQSSRFNREAWQSDWKQVALATCLRRVDDGIPEGMDNISGARQRTERLKMLGNSIVPQVAVEIMKAIRIGEA